MKVDIKYLIFFLFILLPFNYSYGSNNNSCLTKDSNGNIIYNKDSNKKCILIRTIDSNTRNELSNEGLESINGKSCVFDIRHNYTDGEQLAGQILPNGSIRQVRCNKGYSGNIILKCNNGEIDSIGDTGVCTFTGCKKYDSNNTLNPSLSNIIKDTSFINSINQTVEDITTNASNKDTEYKESDIIDTLTCKTGYTGEGYTLRCNGDDEIVLEGEGCKGICIKYENNTFDSSYMDILENQIDIYLTNTDINTLKEKNKTMSYMPNDTVETISCNPNELDYITDNGGWTIKCGDNRQFIVEGSGCAFKSGSKIFDYTGGIQTFTIPKAFTNRSVTLEAWGAQGGGGNYRGGNRNDNSAGLGGYTKLVSKLANEFASGTILYFVVGEKGQDGKNYSPRLSTNAYNGGGKGSGGWDNSWGNYAGGGGGATHIATANGVLSSLSGNKSSIIIVAGGGGGGELGNSRKGGAGGGGNSNGGNGTTGYGGSSSTCPNCDAVIWGNSEAKSKFDLDPTTYPKTQASFGKGGDASDIWETKLRAGGGGGGYYGGGASSGAGNSGGGGSGYCNTSLGTCSGSNGARSGNGYAKISW